ncbi:MAG: ABC transporter permease [Eubacteriales bacterium]|nr:ABC transporter permease [Eubacteriales bacterium]
MKKSTVRYTIGRILFVIPIMLILSFFTFTLTYLSPSDPISLKYERMGAVATQEEIDKIREEKGLNDPFMVQYVTWLNNALHGNLGESYYYGTTVWEEMTKRIPNTLILAGATLVLTILLAVPLGVICAVWQNRWVDYLFRFISFFGVSMPSFWVGTLLMYAFGVKLKLLPIMGSGDFRHLILPAATMAFWMVSIYVRRVRGSMLEEMNKDYLTGALTMGYTRRRAILTQVLPNSLLSVITMFGMSIGSMLGGATIIETIFEWKGIGKMAVDAISVKDYPIIQGYVLWMAIIYVTVNLIVDLSYLFLDPRIRLGGDK